MERYWLVSGFFAKPLLLPLAFASLFPLSLSLVVHLETGFSESWSLSEFFEGAFPLSLRAQVLSHRSLLQKLVVG